MKINNFLWILFIAFTFTKCASLTLEKNPPFSITKAVYQKANKGGSILINYTAKSDIEFKSLFYKGKERKIAFKNGIRTLTIPLKKQNIDIELHGDAKKEFGNKPHPKESDIVFELEDNEAVLSYSEANTVKFYKIKNIEKE